MQLPITQPGAPARVYKPVDPALLQYENEDLLAAGRVAHVTMRQGQRLLSYARPLWGDRKEDRPKIAHILRLIRLAHLTESAEGSREGLDGHLVQVGLAYRRLGAGAHQSIQGRMYMPGMGEVIAPELDQFYRGAATVGRPDLLPPVSVLDVDPRRAQPGSTVTVRGEDWVGVGRVSLFLVDSGTEQRQTLGEVPGGSTPSPWRRMASSSTKRPS